MLFFLYLIMKNVHIEINNNDIIFINILFVQVATGTVVYVVIISVATCTSTIFLYMFELLQNCKLYRNCTEDTKMNVKKTLFHLADKRENVLI